MECIELALPCAWGGAGWLALFVCDRSAAIASGLARLLQIALGRRLEKRLRTCADAVAAAGHVRSTGADYTCACGPGHRFGAWHMTQEFAPDT